MKHGGQNGQECVRNEKKRKGSEGGFIHFVSSVFFCWISSSWDEDTKTKHTDDCAFFLWSDMMPDRGGFFSFQHYRPSSIDILVLFLWL
jgi:hypothetical protein